MQLNSFSRKYKTQHAEIRLYKLLILQNADNNNDDILELKNANALLKMHKIL